MFNEIDDTSADSVEFILVNRGSGSRDLEKRSKNGNLWVNSKKIFLHNMRMMRFDAHRQIHPHGQP